jgi:hypothetical protein
MPDRNKAADAAGVSRRSVLMGAAGAGAAGIAVASLGGAVLPAVAGAAPAGSAPARPEDLSAAELSAADLAGPVIVHVRDAARGEIEVFRGSTATRLHDRELAARLVRASAT